MEIPTNRRKIIKIKIKIKKKKFLINFLFVVIVLAAEKNQTFVGCLDDLLVFNKTEVNGKNIQSRFRFFTFFIVNIKTIDRNKDIRFKRTSDRFAL